MLLWLVLIKGIAQMGLCRTLWVLNETEFSWNSAMWKHRDLHLFHNDWKTEQIGAHLLQLPFITYKCDELQMGADGSILISSFIPICHSLGNWVGGIPFSRVPVLVLKKFPLNSEVQKEIFQVLFNIIYFGFILSGQCTDHKSPFFPNFAV